MPDPDTPLRFLAGIGPAKAEALRALGLETVWDVLHHVPRCLGPPPPLCERGPLPRGTEVRLRARVVSVRALFGRGRGRGLGVEAMLAREDQLPVRARFFNAGYLRRHLLPGEWYLFEGTSDATAAGTLQHPSFVHLASGAASPTPDERGCRVAYRLPEGFSERSFAALVEAATAHLAGMSDPLGTLADADYQAVVLSAHRPSDAAAHERARRLLAARELAAFALRLQARRHDRTSRTGRAWRWSDEIHRRALARLPFALTPGQEGALAEIRADLRAPAPMYRLLQGDVGSGKTALALLAALAVVADGAQVLLLAPTAVLAQQHAAFIDRCLRESRVRTAVLTGGTARDERAQILTALAAHQLDLLVGTHALLEESVRCAELGLAIIDEQHRFGVEQRAALLERAGAGQGYHPDLLLMTATPIPRTLALTVFGDLAVSGIAGRPPGRGAVATRVVRQRSLDDLLAPLAAVLAAGGQAYVICPLREESEKVDAADAQSVHAAVRARIGAQVGLLHGSLGEDAKLAVVAAFARGELRALVSTTVVEVGIDVAAATLMAVLDADRFGLATLHQLRGRVGRGSAAAQCLLFHRAADAGRRLEILATSDDGLAIAEADLAERGPGHLLGTDQHGVLRLRIADLERDLDLLQDAHQRARLLLASSGQSLGSGPPTSGLDRFLRWFSDGQALIGG